MFPEEEEKKELKEKSMPSLFMEINKRYGMRCMSYIPMREMGIQNAQIPFIMIVHDNNGCSQKEIAEKIGVTPPTVNVSIQRLEKVGFVCRRRDEKDQRIMRVYLTEKGESLVREIKQASKSVEEVMFSNFSDTELCLMRRFFEQILDNIEHAPAEK